MRIEFSKYFFWLGCLMMLSNALLAQEKPNILWITIEDTSPQFIGCYGNKDAKTPVIDQLAKEGVRFTNAFSTGTVCSPSRSAIITGVPTYKLGTGHHRSNYPIPKLIKGFPYYLKSQGYYTSNNVKTDYNIANEKDFIKEAWDDSSRSATWRNRGDHQPFFAVFNFADSHQSRTMSMPFDWYLKHVWEHLPKGDRIADSDFDLPPFYRDTPDMRKQFARVYNSIKLTDNRIGVLLDKLENDHLKQNTIIFFFADHGEGMPRGKTNGINLGYRVPFIIWFPEKYKHLSPWGKAGTVSDELIDFEDLAPTIVSLADGQVPQYLHGRVLLGKHRSAERTYRLLSSDRADNGPDLVRTITDGRFVYSRNFMPYMPEARYINYLEIADITKQMRLDFQQNQLNPLQKSLFEKRAVDVLYDIENDVWETKNLVGDTAYRSVLNRMRAQLDAALLQSKDVLFLPEYEIGLLSKTTTPYQFRENDDGYPFADIYQVASLSGKQGHEVIQRQFNYLESQNKIIRYWAAVGLMSQDKSTLKPYKKALESGLNDVYPPVAITMSAILYDHFNTKNALKVLQDFSKSSNMDLALMAINYILYLEDKTPFVETIKDVYKMPKRHFNVKTACLDFFDIMGINEKELNAEK